MASVIRDVDLVAILTAAGVPDVHDERVDPRPGPFDPIGVLNHHTGTDGPALQSCKHGRPDLHGPLCGINIARDGRVNVVCDGHANHAGAGSHVVADAVRNDRPVAVDAKARGLVDDTDGNPLFIGVEVDNDGEGEPLTDVQLDRLVAVNAALCDHFGWSSFRCIHHRQWTRRKQDMHWRGDLPALVAAAMSSTGTDQEDMVRTYIVADVKAPDAKGRQIVGTPIKWVELAGVTVKANDDASPVRALVQPFKFGDGVALSFVGLDGKPVTPGLIGVFVTTVPAKP